MLDDRLRPLKEVCLRPLVPWLRQLSPNTITWLAWMIGLGAALGAWHGWVALSLLLWAVNRCLDGLDGVVARATGRCSEYGGYLDLLLDFSIYAAIPVALSLRADTRTQWMALAALLSAFYVNAASWMYLSAVLEKQGRSTARLTSLSMPAGLVGGTETGLFYLAFLAWPGRNPGWFALMALMVTVGVLQRLLWARRNLDLSGGHQAGP